MCPSGERSQPDLRQGQGPECRQRAGEQAVEEWEAPAQGGGSVPSGPRHSYGRISLWKGFCTKQEVVGGLFHRRGHLLCTFQGFPGCPVSHLWGRPYCGAGRLSMKTSPGSLPTWKSGLGIHGSWVSSAVPTCCLRAVMRDYQLGHEEPRGHR